MSARIDITDLRAVGQYFIRLSKGLEPIPQDTPTAKQKLKDNGANVDDYQDVEFVEDTATKVFFVVRHKDPIEEGERVVNDPKKDYIIQAQADNMYRRHNLDPRPPDDIARKQHLYDIRIGDYCVNQCM